LLVHDFDLKNRAHLLLASVNVFNFWLVGVSACGLSRLTGVSFSKTFLALAVYWVLFCLFFIAVGLGQMAM
jgi:hypothetical protein